MALFSESGIVEQGGAVEALLKITSEEGRGDVSSDTVATFGPFPLSPGSLLAPECESGAARSSVAATVAACVCVSERECVSE